MSEFLISVAFLMLVIETTFYGDTINETLGHQTFTLNTIFAVLFHHTSTGH